MATNWGTGFIPVPPTPPIGTDYSYNWTNLNWGTGIVPEPTKLTGGPGGYYLDFGATTTPPPTSTTKLWDGTQWVGASTVKVWDGTTWVAFAGQKVWDGTAWVTV